MGKVLIVEDDISFSTIVAETLAPFGWLAEKVVSAEDAKQLLLHFNFDIILLDWDLPGMTGIEFCKRYRQDGFRTPIIFVTGKAGVDSLELALQQGADDFIAKPIDARELIARMAALQRRSSNLVTDNIVVSNARLDTKLRKLTIDRNELRLTGIECAIVEFLMRHAGTAFTSNDLHKSIWSSDADSGPDTVRVHVSALRRKLGNVGFKDFIRTLPSQGYCIDNTH